MFLGTYQHNLMDRGRLALPKKIRNSLSGGGMILTMGFEKCILGFDEKKWEETTKLELDKPLFTDKNTRDLQRKIFAKAEYIDLDDQGRFVLPKEMQSEIGISEKATIIGVGNHFEIWESKVWEEYQANLKEE